MKKSYLIIGGVVLVIAIFLIYGISTYNSLVSLRESINATTAEIDVQLERRADLIPNLVNTVKGYVKKITSARASLIGANGMEEKAQANEELTNALDALLVIVENYPDLKANENFINLQDELAGTENRIANARRGYNETVGEYNINIVKFPKNIIAKIFNFEPAEYFQIDESKKDVPNVDFS